MGTQQPAIARLESGKGNPRVRTLIDLAKALDATVRVSIEPVELLGREAWRGAWWEREVSMNPFGSIGPSTSYHFVQNNTINVFVATPGLIADRDWQPRGFVAADTESMLPARIGVPSLRIVECSLPDSAVS